MAAYVPALTYRDYLQHLGDENNSVDRVNNQIRINCGSALDDYAAFMQNHLVENSTIINSLKYVVVEAVKNLLSGAVYSGASFYSCVAVLNNRGIPNIPNQEGGEIFKAAINNDDRRNAYIERYDIDPLFTMYREMVLNQHVEKYPEFQQYPYFATRWISKRSMVLGTAI